MIVRYRIILLYSILVAGALIHVEGSYSAYLLHVLSWILIGLATWNVVELARFRYLDDRLAKSQTLKWQKTFFWSLSVVVITWLLEWLGVNRGLIFGSYAYHDAIRPQIAGVPIAIGFSWLNLLISAWALERRLPFQPDVHNYRLRSLIVAILLLVFDIVLEPSAVKLGYWRWQRDIIPWTNYISWFGIAWVLSYFTFRVGFWRNSFPRITPHFYLAQMIYFGLVYLG